MRITKFTTKTDEVIWEGSAQLKDKPKISTLLNNVTLPDDDYELVIVWTHGEFGSLNYSIYNLDSYRFSIGSNTPDSPYKEDYDFKFGRYVYTGYASGHELFHEMINLPKGLNHSTVSNDEIIRKIILRRTTNYDNTVI